MHKLGLLIGLVVTLGVGCTTPQHSPVQRMATKKPASFRLMAPIDGNEINDQSVTVAGRGAPGARLVVSLWADVPDKEPVRAAKDVTVIVNRMGVWSTEISDFSVPYDGEVTPYTVIVTPTHGVEKRVSFDYVISSGCGH